MLNDAFKNKFPFVFDYFSNLLSLVEKKERKFPQALIFEGADTKEQYLFALELARILNCQNKNDVNCDCINCKWVRSHKHPSVNNVSQIHFKPEGDETKTIISTKQAQEIEHSLALSSDYYRFFIFFSSGLCEYDENELNEFEKLGYDTNIDFKIEPLEHKTFHPAALNALLKSIEEPPENTTFIFLTKSKENILPTIVSRCLVFKLNGEREKLDYGGILNIISNYPDIRYDNAFDFSDALQKYVKDSSDSLERVLNMFMEYLKDIMIKNISDNSVYNKIIKDISFINHAIKQSRASVSDKIVLDTLFLKIARSY